MTERDHKFREAWWKQIENDPNPDLTDGLLAAAYAISTKARVDGTRALMSNRRLAQILKKNERTARRHTQKLRDLGYLALAERGGRRGDGTITANIYELSLPDTQMSPWDISQQVDQVSAWETSQPDKSAPQQDIWESQPDKSAPQQDTQVSAPSLNPSLNPSSNPSYRAAASPVEAAVVNAYSTTRVSNDGTHVGFRNLNQDQKQERLEGRPRCNTCGVGESKHAQWMELIGQSDRHPFVAKMKARS